jgi:hypothetical protein
MMSRWTHSTLDELGHAARRSEDRYRSLCLETCKALFAAIGVGQYAHLEIRFARLVLELGCGDGTSSAMLRVRGVLDAVDVALDCSRKPLRRV